MSMRDRLRRSKKRETTEPESQAAPPPSTGPDEETVRIARKDFRRRRNAGRWRTLRLVLLAVLAVAVVAASVWVVFFSSFVTARDVTVTGTSSLGDGRIERAADVPTGTPLARLDLDAIRARVEAITAVKSAEVSRSWPHTVHIDVTERTPIAVINQGNGLQGLDDQGVLFVNCMAFPPARHDAAFALWQEVNAYMVNQPGYRWHRLHHRVHDDAAFGLVNIVEWESVTAWQAAHDAGFRARAVRDHMPFDAHPTLCRPTASVHAALQPTP